MWAELGRRAELLVNNKEQQIVPNMHRNKTFPFHQAADMKLFSRNPKEKKKKNPKNSTGERRKSFNQTNAALLRLNNQAEGKLHL